MDDPREQVAASERGQAGRRERLEARVASAPADRPGSGTPRRGRPAAVRVSEQAARQAEELNADDRDRERRLLRPLRGTGDQPRRRGDQADAGADRAGAEQAGERQPSARRAGQLERLAERRLGAGGVIDGLNRGRESWSSHGHRRHRRARPPGRRAPPAPAGARPAATVRPRISRRSAASTSSSVAPSRFAVGSSSSSTGARRTNARASATRWRSPTDRPAPRSPSIASRPSGRAATTSVRPAARAASSISAIVASGRPRRMLSAIEAENRCGRCGIHEICARQASGSSSSSSTPPTVTLPASRRHEPEQHGQQRRFAAPARAGDRDDLLGLDRQREPIERGRRAAGVGDRQVTDRRSPTASASGIARIGR